MIKMTQMEMKMYILGEDQRSRGGRVGEVNVERCATGCNFAGEGRRMEENMCSKKMKLHFEKSLCESASSLSPVPCLRSKNHP